MFSRLKTTALVLIILLPVVAVNFRFQDMFENNKFYLSNNTVYSPGQEVNINYYLYGKSEKVTVRILKISNPFEFIKESKNKPDSYYFDIWTSNNSTLLKFAVPVKDFETVLTQSSYYTESKINTGSFSEPGIYIVQAISENNVAYVPFIVTDKVMIMKHGKENMLIYVADRVTGEIFTEGNYSFFSGSELINKFPSSRDGINILKGDELKNDGKMLIIAEINGEFVYSDPYFYFGGARGESLGYIYTNQPVYRPGAAVHIKGILRTFVGNKYYPIQNKDYTLVIRDRNYKEVANEPIKTDENGTFSFTYKTVEGAPTGSYSLEIRNGNESFYGSFKIDEYRKPEYEVSINTGKKSFVFGDNITANIKADYYFGSPVTSGKVRVNIYRSVRYIPWWYYQDFGWYYSNFYNEGYGYYGRGSREFIGSINGNLNSDGTFSTDVSLPLKEETDYNYTIEAEITDASGYSVTSSSTVIVSRGAFNLTAFTSVYFVKPGVPVTIKVKSNDYDQNPVSTKIDLIINKVNSTTRETYEETVYRKSENSDKSGDAAFTFIPEEAGYYKFIATSIDGKGNKISSSGNFYVTGADYYTSNKQNNIEINFDKGVYNPGDTLTAMILLPVEDMTVLLTTQKNSIISYKLIHVKGRVYEYTEVVKSEYIPAVEFEATAVKSGVIYQGKKLVGVIPDERFLNVEIIPASNIMKPGELARYTIKVTDKNGKPVEGVDFSFGTIDESIYAIAPDETPDITKFFYSNFGYYIYTNSSYEYISSNSMSRKANKYDIKMGVYDEADYNRKPKGNFTGKIINLDSTNYYAASLSLVLTDGYKLYPGKFDSSGNIEISNLPEGFYDILLNVDGYGFILYKEVKINANAEVFEKINLKAVRELQDENDGGIYYRSGAVAESDDMSVMYEVAPSVSKSMKMDNSQERGKGGADDFVEPEIRKDFLDAAYWQANGKTGANGTAIIEFTLPDNLTTWRSTVKAATLDTKIGQSSNKVIARKELILRVENPRFFREGDIISVPAIVHNYLDGTKTVSLKFNGEGLEISSFSTDVKYTKVSENEIRFELAANAEAVVTYNVKVKYTGEQSKIYAHALTNTESDAVEIKVPVLPKGVQLHNFVNVNLTKDNNIIEKDIFVPAGVNEASINFSFSVNSTIAGNILKSLDDLIQYPYGCVEQTMSRFLPAIIVSNTFKELNIPLKSESIEKLPDVISKGLKRLYDFQNSSGGWGWWQNDQGNAYISAYVMHGLLLAEQGGYDVSESVLNRGIKFIERAFYDKTIDLTTRSFILYVLYMAQGEEIEYLKGYNQFIAEVLDSEIDPYALGYLGKVFYGTDNTNYLDAVISKLEKSVIQTENAAYWGATEYYYSWRYDRVQNTANVLKFLIEAKPESELIYKSVNWLLNQQKGFSWYSTQQTAMVIFALTDYLKMTKELEANFTVDVFLNGSKILTKSFDKNGIYSTVETINLKNIPGVKLKTGSNTLKIVKNGSGNVYFAGNANYYTKNIEDLASTGFEVVKEYYKLIEVQTPQGRHYRKVMTTEFDEGDLVFVKLKVRSKSKNLDFMMLEDMFPSGFEAVKEDNYFIQDESYYNSYVYKGWRWFYADKEFRDNRISFFVTYSQEYMEFSYILKAVHHGQFSVMPAEASLMYYPDVRGYGNSIDISVKGM